MREMLLKYGAVEDDEAKDRLVIRRRADLCEAVRMSNAKLIEESGYLARNSEI